MPGSPSCVRDISCVGDARSGLVRHGAGGHRTQTHRHGGRRGISPRPRRRHGDHRPVQPRRDQPRPGSERRPRLLGRPEPPGQRPRLRGGRCDRGGSPRHPSPAPHRGQHAGAQHRFSTASTRSSCTTSPRRRRGASPRQEKSPRQDGYRGIHPACVISPASVTSAPTASARDARPTLRPRSAARSRRRRARRAAAAPAPSCRGRARSRRRRRASRNRP